MKTATIHLVTLILLNVPALAQPSNRLRPREFASKINTPGAVVIDVRMPEEFKEGHIKNAINIDWLSGDFEKNIIPFDKSALVLVYCRVGVRGAAAAAKMRTLGYRRVFELDGGIVDWQKAKLPVVKE